MTNVRIQLLVRYSLSYSDLKLCLKHNQVNHLNQLNFDTKAIPANLNLAGELSNFLSFFSFSFFNFQSSISAQNFEFFSVNEKVF